MLRIGRINHLRVLRVTPHGLVLGRGGEEVLLPLHHGSAPPAGVGESLRVFVYTDSEDRPVASMRTPYAVVGDMAYLLVVDLTPHGAFLDWGLDKDLFVPRKEMHAPLRVGQSYVVAVLLDERTQRVMAATRLGKYFDYDVADVEVGDEVDLLVYGINDYGAQVVVDGCHAGLLYDAESFRTLNVGDRAKGYVRSVRADHKLDIRLRREGRAGSLDARAEILQALRAAGGFLPLHDGSPSADIASALDMSKKSFKRAVGGLYKAGRLDLLDDGIRLRETSLQRPAGKTAR